MTHLNEKELEELTQLCHIECTGEEKQKLSANLSRILSYIEMLKQVNTEGVLPCNQLLENGHNVWREDEVGELLSREAMLQNAPSHVGGLIKVPQIIKF